MRVGGQLRIFHMEASLLVQKAIFCLHADHFRQKQIMTAKFQNLFYPALQTDRGLFDGRAVQNLAFSRCQTAFPEFIHLSSGTDAAEIRRFNKLLCCQIHHKDPCLLYQIMGVPGLPDGNRKHRRIGTDGSCPGHGNNIRISFCIPAGNHDGGNRIKEVAGFLKCDFHTSNLSVRI